MREHKPMASFVERSRPADKSQWAISLALGALIAAAGFTLVLSALAWFMPKFLRFADSRWAHFLPVISILFVYANGLVHSLRKRRTSTQRAR